MFLKKMCSYGLAVLLIAELLTHFKLSNIKSGLCAATRNSYKYRQHNRRPFSFNHFLRLESIEHVEVSDRLPGALHIGQ